MASAWSPSHATGFFTIHEKGSRGAGLCLREGMTTHVEKALLTAVYLNGKAFQAPVSLKVIELFQQKIGPFAVNVSHEARAPIGCGLNMSAAGALSLALALNEELGAGLSFGECARIAFEAEIACGTGLGGVVAEATGGFVLRKEPGDFNAVERVPCGEVVFSCGFHAGVETKRIIQSPEWIDRINSVGSMCLKEFEKEKTLESFIRLSRRFSLETGLAEAFGISLHESENACLLLLGKGTFVLSSPGEVLSQFPQRFSSAVTSERACVL